MDEPAKNSIWNYLIPLWHLEQVSSIFGRRGVEVSLTSHCSVSFHRLRVICLKVRDGGVILLLRIKA